MTCGQLCDRKTELSTTLVQGRAACTNFIGIYFVDYGQNSIKLLMTFWVRDISKSFITKDYVNSKIKKTFKEKGIKVYGPKLIRHIK